MTELPKIALARLKANPGTPQSAHPTSAPDAFQGAEHPDANLLAAFVEKALTKGERMQVLDHLSRCAECREIAAYTVPEETTVPEATKGREGRWRPWLVLRWGAMAAALGALTILVIVRPAGWKGHPEISQRTQPPVPAGNIASGLPTPATPPLNPPSSEPARAKAQVEAQGSAGEMAGAGNAAGYRQGLNRNDHIARAKARQQVAMMASARPPARTQAGNVPGGSVKREEGMIVNRVAVGAFPAPALPAAPAAVRKARPGEEAAKTGAELQSDSTASQAPTPSVATAGGGTSARAPMAAPAKVAPRATAQSTYRMMGQAGLGGFQAARKKEEVEARPPAALWSVSSDGKVQRSTDGGKTFGKVQVAPDVKFQAIAARGNDVWAGGASGALFHSPDGGGTWVRVGINFEGNAITETITGVQSSDPQHLTLTTASGTQWVSGDGGQNWQKKP